MNPKYCCSDCGTPERRIEHIAKALAGKSVVCWKGWPQCRGTLIPERQVEWSVKEPVRRVG